MSDLPIHENGIAHGCSNVRDETMTFRYGDEVFTFPTMAVHYLSKWNGYFYEVPVKKLRELATKN